MKRNIIKYVLCFSLIVSCNDFDDINVNPQGFNSNEISAKYFITTTQAKLFSEGRFAYWRANIIHGDRFAGHICFGSSPSWWDDGLGYLYNSGYTDASWNWLDGYLNNITSLTSLVKKGGDLENENYYAIALIMKGLYYETFTNLFGMVPYTEASNPEILNPTYDPLKTIYKGVIKELDEAISMIGDDKITGEGSQKLGGNDLFFNGDLAKWKKLANTLKLRMALRAHIANDETSVFEKYIQEATANNGQNLLLTETENALVKKDGKISQFDYANYGDVWHSFGAGSNWTLSEPLIDALRDNKDPRLTKYAKPIKAKSLEFKKPEKGDGVALFDKQATFLLGRLGGAKVGYKRSDKSTTDNIQLVLNAGTDYYVGQPVRMNSRIKPFIAPEMFCEPADIVINPKNKSLEIFPEIVMSSAEGNFLMAEAIIKGIASGDANSFYQEGIRQAMKIWKVIDIDISSFLSGQSVATLSGSTDNKLKQIALQRWIATYTDGFTAWAIVRSRGVPESLYQDLPADSDNAIYSKAGNLGVKYPQRMRYGNSAYTKNNANTTKAISVQGADEIGTKLWWAKK